MRGRRAPKRKLEPDVRYNSEVVTKLINYVMQDGKKDTARGIVYTAMDELAKATKTDALAALQQAVDNASPDIETKARRVGGSNYQVPTPVTPERKLILAFRWIVGLSRKARKDKPYSFYLAQELIAAFNNEGSAVKKREETERMAESNRAFAQFA